MFGWNSSATTISLSPSSQPPSPWAHLLSGGSCRGLPRGTSAPSLLLVVADVRLPGLRNEDLVAPGVRAVVLHHVFAAHRVVVPWRPQDGLAHAGPEVPLPALQGLDDRVPGQVRPVGFHGVGRDLDADVALLGLVVVELLHLRGVLVHDRLVLVARAPELVAGDGVHALLRPLTDEPADLLADQVVTADAEL